MCENNLKAIKVPQHVDNEIEYWFFFLKWIGMLMKNQNWLMGFEWSKNILIESNDSVVRAWIKHDFGWYHRDSDGCKSLIIS